MELVDMNKAWKIVEETCAKTGLKFMLHQPWGTSYTTAIFHDSNFRFSHTGFAYSLDEVPGAIAYAAKLATGEIQPT